MTSNNSIPAKCSSQCNNLDYIMSAKIIDHHAGLVTVKITGKLIYTELTALQKSLSSIIDQEGSIRVLVITEDFQGWAKEGDWGDVSFQSESDAFIKKMALVGEKKWEDLALMFTGKGFRKFPVEYFESSELDIAKSWLAAG